MLDTIIGMWSVAPSFPAGGVGLGLFLLRVSVTTALLTSICFSGSGNAIQAVSVILALAILIGLRTRFFALFSIGLAAFVSTSAPSIEPVIMTSLIALVLALVGPGAYSLDARLRGRRTVVLPDSEAK